MSNRMWLWLGVVSTLLGYITLWWPWVICALVCFSFSRSWGVALILSVGIDLLWGKPTGTFHALLFPWTVLTGILLLIRFFFAQQVRSRMPEHL